MKKLPIYIIATSLLMFTSCNEETNNEDSSNETKTEKVVEHDEHHEHENHSDSEELALNEGEKWEVNPEMRPHIEGGEQVLSDFMSSADGLDWKKLAEDLSEQNTNLISSCTMKGESHEELHKWLHPHLDLVKALKNEEDADKAIEIIDQLNTSYQTFHEFFQ